MRCILRTPEAELLDGEVVEAVLPATDGEIGILEGHASMILALGVGACRLKTSEETLTYALSGGFSRVHGNVVTVLTTKAEAGESIDRDEAAKALEEAKAAEVTGDQAREEKRRGITWARARLDAATRRK